MNPRSIWTIVAVVIVLAIVFFGYRRISERETTASTTAPATTTAPSGTATTPATPAPATPAPGTTETKPAEGSQTGTSN